MFLFIVLDCGFKSLSLSRIVTQARAQDLELLKEVNVTLKRFFPNCPFKSTDMSEKLTIFWLRSLLINSALSLKGQCQEMFDSFFRILTHLGPLLICWSTWFRNRRDICMKKLGVKNLVTDSLFNEPGLVFVWRIRS